MSALTHEGGRIDDLETGLAGAKQAVRQMKGNAGPLHAVGSFTASLRDAGHDVTPRQMTYAVECVNEALQIFADRGRFYYTRGRLQRQLGHLDLAYEDIVDAIERESQDENDYAMRIAQYDSELRLVQQERRLQAIDARLDETQDSQIKVVEVIAFFSAVVALVLTGVGQAAAVARQDESLASGALIMALTGLLLLLAVVLGARLLGGSRQ
jgi:tetratricopeptide (TPR) repeat protein